MQNRSVFPSDHLRELKSQHATLNQINHPSIRIADCRLHAMHDVIDPVSSDSVSFSFFSAFQLSERSADLPVGRCCLGIA